MGSHQVDLGLRYGSHANLIESAGEERCKGTAEDDVTIPAREPNPDTHQVLLSDEAFNVAVVEGFLVGEGEGGVLGVSVKS